MDATRRTRQARLMWLIASLRRLAGALLHALVHLLIHLAVALFHAGFGFRDAGLSFGLLGRWRRFGRLLRRLCRQAGRKGQKKGKPYEAHGTDLILILRQNIFAINCFEAERHVRVESERGPAACGTTFWQPTTTALWHITE